METGNTQDSKPTDSELLTQVLTKMEEAFTALVDLEFVEVGDDDYEFTFEHELAEVVGAVLKAFEYFHNQVLKTSVRYGVAASPEFMETLDEELGESVDGGKQRLSIVDEKLASERLPKRVFDAMKKDGG